MSSIKVNGERTMGKPFTAFDEPDPRGHYALSKLAAEDALKMLGVATGIEVMIVRPPLDYGPGVGAKGHRLRLFSVPHSLLRTTGRLLGRETDVSRLCDSLHVDASPAWTAFGWAPPIAVDKAVEGTVSWFVSGSRVHV